MSGKLHIYHARGALTDPPEVREVETPNGWDQVEKLMTTLRGILEDDLEQVPLFDTVQMGGEIVRCVALCPEHGKDERKPTNRRATLLWRYALTHHSDQPMARAAAADVLAGTVVILTGDREFLASL